MDLGAYAQIDDLSKIMEDNGIDIPRLRGLRLMKDEKPVPDDELKTMAKEEGLRRCADLCQSLPPFNWNSCVSELSDRTDALIEYYCVLPRYESGLINHMDPIDIRWDRVHGKKRKAFKYVIKKAKKDVYQQYEMWNKYAGRSDVLYIHCRLGAGNWGYYKGWDIIESQPWFLDKVEDYFDHTYMDIYAKIKEVPNEHYEHV